MTNEEFLGEFLSLPVAGQRQVIRLINFLKDNTIHNEPPVQTFNPLLTHDPFVGMWHDRQDLEDPNWVRNLREREWSKNDV